jgi:anti-anti-sigma factor
VDLPLAPEVRRGDHACCVFASDEDRSRLVGRFAHDAFARGDRLFYLADCHDEAGVVELLDEAGLDGGARLDRGELQVMHSSEMGLEGGFDPERQVAAWSMLVDQARSDGYGGLAAAAEMTWVRTWGLDDDAVVYYEATAAPVFARGGLAALCQYDSRQFEPSLVDRAKAAHALAVAVDDDTYSIDYARLHLHHAEAQAEIAVRGEIDLASVGFLEDQLAQRLQGGDAVADCSQVEFIDVAGCRLLRRACVGDVANGRLRLDNTPDAVARVMNICKWADGAT